MNIPLELLELLLTPISLSHSFIPNNSTSATVSQDFRRMKNSGYLNYKNHDGSQTLGSSCVP